MDSLFVAAAKLMPEDMLLKELEKALEGHKVLRTKTTRSKLEMFCLLCVTRYATEGEELRTTIKKFEEAQALGNLFKNKEQ